MTRFPGISTAVQPERAVLVGIAWRSEQPGESWPVDRSLDELERLADTAGATVVARMTQRLDRPVPRSYIGSGKVEELASLVHRLDADVVIFDDNLTPSQQSFLERAVGEPIKIIDRTALILDIFGLHAKTHEGRLQVQLAQLQYLLPRLRGMWSHLAKEQTRGGIGSRFGQGESQLEVDRRMIRNRIASLRRELTVIAKHREVQAHVRSSSPTFRVALAGYTNAGKSTLLNQLTGSNVLSQDKLFATLDPTTRSYALPGGRLVTLTDTVGFIQKLPHGLVEAFKSTLGEIRDADLILKVVDVSDPDHIRHLDAVASVLDEIGVGDHRAITVFNKIDLLSDRELAALRGRHPHDVLFSARTGEGLDGLRAAIAREASFGDELISILLPYTQGALSAIMHTQCHVIAEEYTGDGSLLTVKVPAYLSDRLEPFRIKL